MSGQEPGRGRSRSQRHVDVPAAPVTDFGEWAKRPLKNTEVLAPGPAREQHHVDIPAAPRVVDVNALIDRATRGLSADLPGDDAGHLIG